MSDKEDRPAEEQEQPAESAPSQPSAENAQKSVKTGTLVILTVILLSLTWYLLADRFTPYTRQARAQGFVIGIAPKVAGVVTEVWVKNNQTVDQDQQLFQIDRSQYEIALKRAQSDLENTRSQVDAGGAGVETARANLRAALANEEKTAKDAKRQQRMYKEDPGTISVRRLEVSQATWEQAKANVAAAQAEIQRAIEQMGGEADDNPKMKAAQSAVEKAKLDLENTVVRSPSSGIITDLRADVGQYAGTGGPVVTLIAIHDVWINAEFTENNLGNLKEGNPASLVFDSLPGRVFEGRVRSIGLGVSAGQVQPAGNLPQVDNNRDWLRQAQRFPVVIGFDRHQSEELRGQLRVGGQVEVMAFSDGHPVLRQLGRLYMRLMSWFSYLY
jgi:multidrug resistance efflux pump